MQTKIDIPSSERYLVCNYFFTELTIEKIKRDVEHFMSSRDKDECYWQFMKWHNQNNEIAVLTMYAYANLPLPKKFDTIFDLEHATNYSNTDFLITQAVFNGLMPSNEISHGHKHVVIIQFDGAVPDIFHRLPAYGNVPSYTNTLQLGFCSKIDFEVIKDKLMTQKPQIPCRAGFIPIRINFSAIFLKWLGCSPAILLNRAQPTTLMLFQG